MATTRTPRAPRTVAPAATAEVAAPAATVASEEDTIALIQMGEKSEQGFAFIPMDAVCDTLVAKGLIEVNQAFMKSDTNPPQIAARMKVTTMTDATAQDTSATTADTTTAPATVKREFVIRDFVIPEQEKQTRKRAEVYPFSKLEVGKAFFIPPKDGDTQDDLFSALSSTIATANNRYAVPHPEGGTEMRRDKEVPRMQFIRVFGRVRATENGVAGVMVFRKQ